MADSENRNFVSVRGLSKRFGALNALNAISFDVREGEIHALCGENGAGKSTLVKLLTGIHRPDSGTIAIGANIVAISSPKAAQELGIALVAQELSLCPDLSVLDNIWLGSVQVPLFHRRPKLRDLARESLNRIGAHHIGLDAKLASLSLGERQLVEIARGLARDAKLLILDEPTATLSNAEIERIFTALAALKAEGRAVIYITHRLGEVFRICDRVTVLRNGEHVATREVNAFDRSTLIEAMLGRDFVEMYPEAATADSEPILTVSNLSAPNRFADITFAVPNGKILCLAGQIGSGTSDIVDALAGLVHDAGGTVRVEGRSLRLGSPPRAAAAGLMFISGDRAEEGVFRRLPVFDNLVATRLADYAPFGVLRRDALKRTAARLAAEIGFDPNRLAATLDTLSGGNQQKIAFARCLDRDNTRVLLMNEPTRGVDVGARADIYRLMRQFCASGHALVMASSDLEEVLGLSDIVVTLYRGRIVGTYTRGAIDMAGIVADITHPVAAGSKSAA